ncbi:uncharacterized protein FTOL_06612 [Fusarium torulosum]|uniref:DUF6603 domain-containing protein n=1 Tax=Fusarium torulosum TaxID=33205 RepID=A0AAE8MA44_9HYPO|nr:uncharacterized protein FTOL_06612 [Fusarium torulosum]
MVCVAAERKIIGNTVDNFTTPTNMSSIVFLIVWLRPTIGFRVSHYFAGDAHTNLENAVANWIGAASITSLKLSHHGASTSNPAENYAKFQPKNVIVSAGGQYGHPTWQVILAVWEWYVPAQNAGNKVIRKPFLPCQWPYWLVSTYKGGNRFTKIKLRDIFGGKKMIQGKTPPRGARKAVGNVFKKLNLDRLTGSKTTRSRLKNPFSVCWTRRDTDGNEKINVDKFLDACRDLMPQISAINTKDIGTISCEIISLGKNKPKTLDVYGMLCYQITSSPNEAEDGEAYIFGVDIAGKKTADALQTSSHHSSSASSSGVSGVPDTSTKRPVMEQDFPNHCSAALLAARTSGGLAFRNSDDDDNYDDPPGAVDMSPYKGFDQPRVIDLTEGVPDWDEIEKWDKKGLSAFTLEQDTIYSTGPSEQEEMDDDWDNIGDSLSLASFGSRRASWASSASNVNSDLGLPMAQVHALAQVPWLPIVSFQVVPPDIRALAAKVYLTCQDEKDPETRVKVPEGSEPCVLHPKNTLHGFLNTLHFQGIGLAKVPDDKNTTPVDTDDEIFQWLARFSGWDPEKTPVPKGFAFGMRKVSEWPIKDLEKKAKRKTMVPYDAPAVKGKGPDAGGSEKGVKAPYKVKVGPLSVGNLGLWFKDGMIGVTLDATLIMGPLGLSLLGFAIGVPFGGKYFLANPPPPSAIDWGLSGLSLSMDKPPLTIAGGFTRDTSNPDVEVMYTGGLIVGFKPWSFEAMGAYATVYKTQIASGEWVTTIDTKPLSQFSLLSLQDDVEDANGNEVAKADGEKRPTFTFSFIYVKMNGPLFSVGFADVAGLVGGFGINSDITLPTVEQVISFPFVAERDSSKESTPVERMQDLMEGSWFRPAEGLYWAAAGARVTAFQMFAANIVLVLQFGNGNLLFGIFGVATCDVPALEAPVKFAHVELGIVCTFDVNSGIFKFEAQLSPRSFVLAPQCHLTGGMALFSWTKGDHSDSDPKNQISAGDWVLTIGGYHRAFFPPKQYPKPPRLGISWSLSSCLSVKGEAYFAITPKVCMGGGKIRAALSIGLLYAWFDAFMDFLMNFDPFYFQMTARVSVGVRFTLDLWLVTIRISVEISAGLDLMGPPFGGVVHVDFWVFGFDIKFGASPKPPPAIGLDRFFQVATKSGSSSASSSQGLLGGSNGVRSEAKPQPDTAAILLTCETGLLPPIQDMKAKSVTSTMGDNPEDDKWYVKGGNFTLNASFQIPVTAARLTETRMQAVGDGRKEPETRYAECNIEDNYKKVYAKPMQLHQPLTSTVAISVKAPEPRKKKTQDVHVLESWSDQKWKLAAQVKPVQSSIWGQYDRNQDPSQVKGPIEGLLNGKDATMQLVTGIGIVPPNPAVAGDLANKFNVTKDHMASVFNPKKPDWPLFIGVTKDQETAWAPKERGTDWDAVTGDWKKVGDTTTSKAVDLWAKRMRYDEQSVEGDQKDEKLKGTFSPLRGIAPKKLLNNFKQLVPALPLVAVGF